MTREFWCTLDIIEKLLMNKFNENNLGIFGLKVQKILNFE
jgi:hypothetical protein